MWLDAEVINELYDSSKLFHGGNITVPWNTKEAHWKASFVHPSAAKPGMIISCTIEYTFRK